MKIVIIGTYPPRKCGIATFTHDLYQSLTKQEQDVEICAVMDGTENDFPHEVSCRISRDIEADYINAATVINGRNYDCCIIQHEFGIFGNTAGDFILLLAEKLKIPIITNLHTVLETPSRAEYVVVKKLAALSRVVTVMTNRAITMLKTVYDISTLKIRMVPHGIPEFTITSKQAKEKLGLENKKVMLSFGLLGPSKGYEVSIQAVAKVIDEDFVYIILGATHPNILLHEGDAYKDRLTKLTADLNQEQRVTFVNEYASDELLQTYLKACDIYVTPYPNVNQMSSGTLTFALGAGAAVLSTPYWYAQDLLAEGRGGLFDFNDANGLAHSINALLTDKEQLNSFRQNAAAFGETISWRNVAKMQIALISSLIGERKKALQRTRNVRRFDIRNNPNSEKARFSTGKIGEDRRSTI